MKKICRYIVNHQYILLHLLIGYMINLCAVFGWSAGKHMSNTGWFMFITWHIINLIIAIRLVIYCKNERRV